MVEILFIDFLPIAGDELFNQAAKIHYMFGGQVNCPIVVRTAVGAGIGAAAHHSQSLEALVCHIPGLKTIAPATPADAKGLLIAAIRDDNPVVFLEHKMLYASKGEVPEGDYTIPIGKADVKREGGDVTLICYSAMVRQCLAAAEGLAKDGVSAEVLDLRTLIPLDKEAILESVAKTGRGGHCPRGLPHRRLRRGDRGDHRRRGVRVSARRPSSGWPARIPRSPSPPRSNPSSS